ncbi:MAG: hypothetical protein PW792_10295 [Acidobacteriaceae bacterium]|nr:hypothetical protein [Acidobacteriaceae bacterium]
MRRVFLGLALALLPMSSVNASGQSPANLPSVPTTKVLALGKLSAPLTEDQRKGIMTREVPDTVRLYLAGKIDQWYVRTDGRGVVFLLNVSSVDEARTLLERLPLGQAKLMSFDLIPLGPLSPLALLLKERQ